MVTYKFDVDPIKSEGAILWITTVSPLYKIMEFFF